ncbi:hypothetical protein Tco_1241947, partial [Tanacetum coccineum]
SAGGDGGDDGRLLVGGDDDDGGVDGDVDVVERVVVFVG